MMLKRIISIQCNSVVFNVSTFVLGSFLEYIVFCKLHVLVDMWGVFLIVVHCLICTLCYLPIGSFTQTHIYIYICVHIYIYIYISVSACRFA